MKCLNFAVELAALGSNMILRIESGADKISPGSRKGNYPVHVLY